MKINEMDLLSINLVLASLYATVFMFGPMPYKIIGMEANLKLQIVKEVGSSDNVTSFLENNTSFNISSGKKKEYYTTYLYEVIVYVVLDAEETCSLNFGDDTEEEEIVFPVGLGSRSMNHEYINSGSYNITCTCTDIVRAVDVPIQSTEDDISFTISGDKYYDGSSVALKVMIRAKTIFGEWDCVIYIDKKNHDQISIKKRKKKSKDEFTTDDTEIFINEPGWHEIGLECTLDEFMIYKYENVFIQDKCFNKTIFTLYPRTTIQSPFVIFRIDEKVNLSKSDFVLCNSKPLTYEWKLQKMIEGELKDIEHENVTLDLEYLDFLPYSTHGLYKIDLEVSSGDRKISDTLYIKFSEVLKPLSFLGGDISTKSLGTPLYVLHEIAEYYMWCYRTTKQILNFTEDSLQVKSDVNYNCSDFTNDTYYDIPNEKPGIYLVKVIAVSDFGFRIIQKHLQVDNSTLDINISCVFNCNGQLSIRNDWSLGVSISLAPGQNISLASFFWELYRYVHGSYEPVEDWEDWTAGLFTSSITLSSDHVAPATKYRIAIKVVWLDKVAYATYDAMTGIPPTGGECELTPLTGQALDTLFQVKCSRWFDDGSSLFQQSTSNATVKNAELKYMILFSSGSHEWVLSYKSDEISDHLYFGMGDEENDYKAKITVRIYDVYFSFASVVFEVTMEKPNIANEDLQAIQDYLLNFLAPENTDQDSHYVHLSKINSVASFVISMVSQIIMSQPCEDDRYDNRQQGQRLRIRILLLAQRCIGSQGT
ncbi:uncharacterized protein LOC106879406 [Octopus bimaculoides]|uniref:uncharacterized protein LOC106879406 n=1 Tax=Octopus bimaculoides TaxID=37653 RepID=UPI0022E260F1|nr:uncharacterized protein LOC106879406 [Octopus bimaculoides]